MAVEITALLIVLAPVASAIVAHVARRRSSLQLAREFFSGTRCALCDAPIPEPHFAGHAPALRDAGGVTRQWSEFSNDELRAAWLTCRPVCWNCHVAEEFRRRFPQLVTDRPAR